MACFSIATAGLLALSVLGTTVQAAPAVNDQSVLGFKSFGKRDHSFDISCSTCIEWFHAHSEPSDEEKEIFNACMDDCDDDDDVVTTQINKPRDITYTMSSTVVVSSSVAATSASASSSMTLSGTPSTIIVPSSVVTLTTTNPGSSIIIMPPSISTETTTERTTMLVTPLPPSTTTAHQTVTEKTTMLVTPFPQPTATVTVTSTPSVIQPSATSIVVVKPMSDDEKFNACLHEHKIDQELRHCEKHHGDKPDHLVHCLCKETNKGMKKCASSTKTFHVQDVFHAQNVNFCNLAGMDPTRLAPATTDVFVTQDTTTTQVKEVIPAFTDVHPSTSTHTATVTIARDIYGQVLWEKGAAGSLAIPLLSGFLALLAGVIGLAL